MEHVTGHAAAGVCRGKGLLGAGIKSSFGCVAAEGNGAIKSGRRAGISQWYLNDFQERGVSGMQLGGYHGRIFKSSVHSCTLNYRIC